jgi:hypothetical protein
MQRAVRFGLFTLACVACSSPSPRTDAMPIVLADGRALVEAALRTASVQTTARCEELARTAMFARVKRDADGDVDEADLAERRRVYLAAELRTSRARLFATPGALPPEFDDPGVVVTGDLALVKGDLAPEEIPRLVLQITPESPEAATIEIFHGGYGGFVDSWYSARFENGKWTIAPEFLGFVHRHDGTPFGDG